MKPTNPAEMLGRQLRERLADRRMTQAQLADAMTALGVPMTQGTISKTIKATRPVTLAEALAYGVALNVSPARLVVGLDDAAPVSITPKPPKRTVQARDARRWIEGRGPLPGDDASAYWKVITDDEFAERRETDADYLLERLRDALGPAAEICAGADLLAAQLGGEHKKAAQWIQERAAQLAAVIDEINDRLEQVERATKDGKGRGA